jgi:hypothetical protein
MDRDTAQTHSGPIHHRRKYLLKGAELLRKCGLEIERDLELGNWCTHVLPVLSGAVEKNSGKVARIDVRPELVSGDTAQPLKNKNSLRGDDSGGNPLRYRALVDTDLPGDLRLSAGGLYSFLDAFTIHKPDSITETDTEGNTQCDSTGWHHHFVKKKNSESGFWARLCEAAEANGIEPSQSAIARVFKIRQSAVNRWTGKGRPKLTRLEEIADEWGYNVNWLLAGVEPKRPPGRGERDDTSELLAIWKTLNPRARKAVLEQAKLVKQIQAPARETEPA